MRRARGSWPPCVSSTERNRSRAASRGRTCAGARCLTLRRLLDALLASRPEVVSDGDIVRERGRAVTLQDDEQQARDAIEGAFERAGLAVPSLAETLARSGVPPAKARSLLAILLREKTLVRVGEDLVFHGKALQELRAMMAARRPARFGVPEFKEWTGISRKYAIPLLEYLDRERVTRRDGDARVIL
jgi:selenocysteine-specific elongation factor